MFADRRGKTALDDAFFGRRAEDDAGAGAGGAGNLRPELVQLLVRHPVLRVEQDITVARGGGFLGEKLGEACVMDVDAIDIGADHLVVLPLQIGRQRAFVIGGIPATKSLPGEIVFAHRKMAGELFEAMLQHRCDRLIGGEAGKLVILLRRNAKTEKRALAPCNPAHHRLFEEGRNLLVEELALFADRAGLCHLFEIDAVQAGEQMGRADEAAEQAGLIEIAVEDGDAAAAELAAVP
ncbi:hypothetical protein AJ87_32285 [Rhizobium yanglingense]|nr:hypothetical protein AJ87_32285 [Rhizobium yanglingense]